jgi:solute carrier family 35 (UDP-galactose transporter), member B1
VRLTHPCCPPAHPPPPPAPAPPPAAGIYVCYLAYGIFQETLYKTQSDGSTFAATAFVLFFQCVVNGVVSLFVDAFKTAGQKDAWRWLRTIGARDVILTSVVYVSAMYMSNEALQYVTYPTQALAKSIKMVPVLIGRVLIAGERYGPTKYICVLLMTLGITLFQMWGKASKMTGQSFGGEGYGLMLLVVSLVFDGISGPCQEKLKNLHLSNTQQIVVNNFWAAALMGAVSLYIGEFWTAVSSKQAAQWQGRQMVAGYGPGSGR